MSSQDIQDVITYDQQGVKVIDDEEITKKLYDDNFGPIIVVLREGPLTIKELEEKYNAIAEETKSEMTIYRYVKELDKDGIVTEVGKKIKKGQSASETLYGRTAKIFWNLIDKEDHWKTNESKAMLDVLVNLLKLYSSNAKITSEALGDLLYKISQKTSHELAKFFEANDDAINGYISGFSFKDVDKIFDILGSLILLMNSDEFSKELEKCGC